MKVSEAIDQLKVGDTVWVKGKVLEKDDTKSPLYLCLGCGAYAYKWLREEDEISLTEPKNEKVEVPDFVAEWFEKHKHQLGYSIWELVGESHKSYTTNKLDMRHWICQEPNEPIETLIRMKDGYTVKPKRWVVKSKDHIGLESFVNGTVNPMWTTEEPLWMTFTDKSKAEAVATLVEGSVEEV